MSASPHSTPAAGGPSLHPVGAASLALVPGAGRLYWLDEAATAIAHALDEGESPDAIAKLLACDAAQARQYVTHVRVQLWPDALRAPETFGVLRWRPEGSLPPSCVGTRSFRVLDNVVRCRFTDPAMLHNAARAFAHLAVSPGDSATSFDIGRDVAGVRIARGTEVLDETIPPAALLNALRLLLTETAFARSPDAWAVHAAAVTDGARAVLLPGTAGCGKSTLALHLAQAGFTVFGDDTVVLARETLALRALPFPLCVKQGSWPLANALLPAPRHAIAGVRADGFAVRWLPPQCGIAFAPSDARAEVRAIVFPCFAQDAPCQLQELACDAVLRRLLPGLHPLGAGLTAELVDRLLAWVRGRQAFALTYGNAGAAVAAVQRLFA